MPVTVFCGACSFCEELHTVAVKIEFTFRDRAAIVLRSFYVPFRYYAIFRKMVADSAIIAVVSKRQGLSTYISGYK